MKILSLLASTSLVAAAACGADDPSNPDMDAAFSSADDLHRARAITAALGFDYAIAYFLASAYSGVSDPEGCPRIVVDGPRTTVTGDCDGENGRVEGRIVIDNVPQLFGDPADVDPSRPQTVEFEDYQTDDGDDAWTLDGSIRLDPAAGGISAQLTLGIDGLTTRSDLRMTCTEDDDCTAAAGSWVEVDGIGAAAVSGTWNIDSEAPSGSVTLTGAEVLVLDLDGTVDECIPYTIDGAAAGQFCDGDGEGEGEAP